MSAIPGGHPYGRSLTRREKSLPAIFYETEKGQCILLRIAANQTTYCLVFLTRKSSRTV
ncbi:hypothetical protein [Pseudohongiella nitratireducens]|uniref:hypothetical protein n=1 Tax=Pseudohongiella nitratireducens TaxID=1768907 RepID=UPI0030ECD441